MNTAWRDFIDALKAGFRPPTGPGRCPRCAFHTATQGHRDGCPDGAR